MAMVTTTVCPRDSMADWELWFAVAAPYLKRASYNVSVACEKIQIQTLKYCFQ
jgi:hypothetical protein